MEFQQIIFVFGDIQLCQETDVAGVICSGIGCDQFKDVFGKSKIGSQSESWPLKPFIHGLHNCLGKEEGGLTLPAGLWPAGNGGVSHILKGDGEAVFEEAVDVAVLQN